MLVRGTIRCLSAVTVIVILLGSAWAGATRGTEKIGIVLMHGLQGDPYHTINGLADAMSSAGYLVATPEMCWSRRRMFDLPYADCLRDIDSEIAGLKGKGATAIVVAGQSLGGMAALGYGATHSGLLGLIALAPSPNTNAYVKRAGIADSLEKARALMAGGKGDAKDSFNLVNVGRPLVVYTTAKIYLSFFEPGGASDLELNYPNLKAPVLWVAGDEDRGQTGRTARAFGTAPANPLNRAVTVNADHLGTPDAAKDAVLAWLKDLIAGN